MPRSQNGWRANDRSLITYWRAGRNQVLLSSRKGDVKTVMTYIANRWDRDVNQLVQRNGQWGYAERAIRGSSTTSNHASGTAIDLDAALHPLGTSPSANFSNRQLSAVRRIVNACRGVIRWGGDYSGRKDGMHFEVNTGAAAVNRLADDIKHGNVAGAAGTEQDMAYASLSLGKQRQLTAGKWNTIGFDNTHVDPDKKHSRGDPSILKRKAQYSVKYTFRITGITAGEEYKVRIIEAQKKSGKWRNVNTVAWADLVGGGGDEYQTLVSGPDSMAKKSRVWFQVYPTSSCTMTGCAAKALYQ